jgi:hypothetical protein
MLCSYDSYLSAKSAQDQDIKQPESTYSVLCTISDSVSVGDCLEKLQTLVEQLPAEKHIGVDIDMIQELGHLLRRENV